MTDHPRLPGRLAEPGLTDTAQSWPVSSTESVYSSAYVSLDVDTIVGPSGDEHARAVVRPNGAIGIVVIDENDRLLLVEQYRHPVEHRLLEIPAGTLDVAGESPLDAAARELAEEADLVAGRWTSLLHMYASPGYSSEAWEVFLATELSAVPLHQRTVREAEEADMFQWWMPFDEAVEASIDGRIRDAMAVAAILAAQVQRSR